MQQGSLILWCLVVLPSINFMFTNTQARIPPSHSPAPTPTPLSSSSSEQVYIVYISDKPPHGIDPHTYYIKFLTPVLGSVKAAKEALVYSYGIVSGFAAKLSGEEASRLKKQAEVTYVLKEIKYWLNRDAPYQPAPIHS